jgi:hypothetical protein
VQKSNPAPLDPKVVKITKHVAMNNKSPTKRFK